MDKLASAIPRTETIKALSPENPVPGLGFLNQVRKYQPVQLTKLNRGLKFWLYKLEVLYYLRSARARMRKLICSFFLFAYNKNNVIYDKSLQVLKPIFILYLGWKFDPHDDTLFFVKIRNHRDVQINRKPIL